MALTNKRGETPAELQKQEELLAYVKKLYKEQENILNRLTAIERSLSSQQSKLDALPHPLTSTQDEESSYQVLRETKHLSWYASYSFIGLIMLCSLVVLSHFILTSKLTDTQQINYTIKSLLLKEETFWYDAENHQLYLKDTSHNR